MKTIEINIGETKEVYFYINLTGKLHYKISNESGTNRLKFWWVKGPFGNVEGLGELIGEGSLPYKGLVWGKLKASSADSQTFVQIEESSKIVTKFPPIYFP
jgi:hypothetical protein